jgi:hypothetical protein
LHAENEEERGEEDKKSGRKPAGRKRKLSGSTDATQPAMKYQGNAVLTCALFYKKLLLGVNINILKNIIPSFT